MQGRAVDNWEMFEFQKYCSDYDCDINPGGQCSVRKGLLSRAFLSSNQLAMTVRPGEVATEVWRPRRSRGGGSQ